MERLAGEARVQKNPITRQSASADAPHRIALPLPLQPKEFFWFGRHLSFGGLSGFSHELQYKLKRDFAAVFDLAFAEVVQVTVPTRIRSKIVDHALRNEDTASLTAIHHPLRDVDPGTGDIGTVVAVANRVHGVAVNPHPQSNLGVLLQFRANLHRPLECNVD